MADFKKLAPSVEKAINALEGNRPARSPYQSGHSSAANTLAHSSQRSLIQLSLTILQQGNQQNTACDIAGHGQRKPLCVGGKCQLMA